MIDQGAALGPWYGRGLSTERPFCSPSVCQVFTKCSLSVHQVFPLCSLCVPFVFPFCSLSVPDPNLEPNQEQETGTLPTFTRRVPKGSPLQPCDSTSRY